jgi:hypothetical protein
MMIRWWICVLVLMVLCLNDVMMLRFAVTFLGSLNLGGPSSLTLILGSVVWLWVRRERVVVVRFGGRWKMK